jgi:hypothetical protein
MTINQIALISENELDVITANSTIESNAGIPTQDGKTTKWCVPKKANGQIFWYIIKPSENGFNGISQETMVNGLVNVTEQPFDKSWNATISESK